MNPAAQRGPNGGQFNPSIVTPSKPERWNGGNPAARQPLPPNARPNPSAMPGRPMGAPAPMQNNPNMRPGPPPQQRPGMPSNAPNPNAQAPIKREPAPALNPDANPPSASQSVGFFSARAADSLRDNPNGAPVLGSQFDPHAESPSIRKTAGVDHTKSVPISRPMLAGASPSSNNNNNNSRDYVNPATDLQRRVGAPGGPPGGPGSPLSRGPSTSSYRPLTRPNVDQRSVSGPTPMNRGSVPPQNNPNGKRPPLNDVTNASGSPGAPGAPPPMGPNDPKRARVSDVGPGQPPAQPPQA